MARQLYCDIDGITRPLNVSISNAHGNATSLATIQCDSRTKDIGDRITIDLGFTDDHGKVFDGYIKTMARNVPEDTYTITAQDKIAQAVDYFVIGPSPDEPYNFGKGIAAEDLVDEVLHLAGLHLTHIDATHFEFGVNNDVEVNLTSAYDYCKMIADIVTWNLWCDMDGDLHFENRKPYVMTGSSGQIGDTVDERTNPPTVPIASINDLTITNAFYNRSEKEIRNRVVVYGEGGIKSDQSEAETYDPYDSTMKQILPLNFYKSVIVSYAFIGDQSLADDIANYNLELLNRVTESLSVTCEGNHLFEPRKIIDITEPYVGITGHWYIYGSTLNWSKAGFTADLDLRR